MQQGVNGWVSSDLAETIARDDVKIKSSIGCFSVKFFFFSNCQCHISMSAPDGALGGVFTPGV